MTTTEQHQFTNSHWHPLRSILAMPNGDDAASILRLAAPAAGIALVNMAMGVTDTIMAAQLGADALAAIAVGSDFYSIVFYLAIGCIGGLAPLYASAHAAGDRTLLERLRSAAWILSAAVALPLFALLWFAPETLRLLGANAVLVEGGSGYSRAMAVTFVPMLAAAVLRSRLTAIERPGAMLRVTLAAVPLNAALNHVLMHGGFGMAGLGLTGAGVSSAIVAGFILAGMSIATHRHDRSRLGAIDWTAVWSMLRVGLPIGIAFLAQVGIYLGATIYAATLTVNDAAAHGLAIRIAGVTFAFHVGLQQASMVRLARAGSERVRRREVVATSLWLAGVTGAILCCALLMLAPTLSGYVLGGSNVDVVRMAVIAITLLALSDLIGPTGAAAGGLLRALNRTRPEMIHALLANWVVAAPLGLLLTSVYGMGAAGIWVALTAGTVLESVLTPLALRRHLSSAPSA